MYFEPSFHHCAEEPIGNASVCGWQSCLLSLLNNGGTTVHFASCRPCTVCIRSQHSPVLQRGQLCLRSPGHLAQCNMLVLHLTLHFCRHLSPVGVVLLPRLMMTMRMKTLADYVSFWCDFSYLHRVYRCLLPLFLFFLPVCPAVLALSLSLSVYALF